MREIKTMLAYAPLTAVVVLVCTIFYLLGLYLQRNEGKSFAAYLLGAVETEAISQKHQYWRLAAANFVHVDLLHFLFNVYFLIDLGTWLESQAPSWMYLLLLVLSGLFSTGLTYLYDKKRKLHHLTFGASGFAFGILGFVAGLMLFQGQLYRQALSSFIPLIIVNVVYTFSQKNISKTGHAGGFIAGLLVSLLW